ncbi:MAG: glycosyltransferase family 9 protein [Candidatus Latescibacterota bacterium]
MSYHKICIFRTGALGDVILTLPVIHNLQYAFPLTHIDLIGNPNLLSLAPTNHIQIHDINRALWAPLFAPNAQITPEITHIFQNTDLVISYLPDPDQALTHNLHNLGVTQIDTCLPRPPKTIHATDHLLTPLHNRNIPTPITHPTIQLNQKDFPDITRPHPKYATLLIHPGSGGKNKCWSPNHFAITADTLIRQTGCQVFLSSGPADGNLAEKISHLMTEKNTLLPPLPIRQFAAFMTTCQAYLGNDSGPTHLAAAADICR